jgi:hypothetical protein
MVGLYVGGKKVDWTDAAKVFSEPLAASQPIEFRDEAGKVVARVVPESIETHPDDPDWVKAITPEEVARRMAGPFLTLDDYRRRTPQQ